MKTNKLKIAIIGYGSMGKQIEKAATDKGHVITEIFDIGNPVNPGGKYNFDVAIDFSFPDAVTENVKAIVKLKKNIVIGTTGWEADFKKIKSLVEKNGIAAVYGSNFSVGMQMFFRIAELASKLKNHHDEYDIFIHEMHHKRKKDSPSGTALTLADIVLKNVLSKKVIKTDKCEDKISLAELHVSSTRGGETPGTHTIYIDSGADTIELTHTARNRTGFADGAIIAAEWAAGKQGFFNFRDVVDSIWKI